MRQAVSAWGVLKLVRQRFNKSEDRWSRGKRYLLAPVHDHRAISVSGIRNKNAIGGPVQPLHDGR